MKMSWMILVLSIMIISACTPETTMEEEYEMEDEALGAMEEKAEELEEKIEKMEESTKLPLWYTAELTDVNSGNSFSVEEFKGQNVLVESFAVWCPLCKKQQDVLKELGKDEAVHIALNTDPNEDESLVKDHAAKNDFDWNFAVSPSEVTQSLVDEFGVSIVSAPSVPMILICKDGSYRKLGNGVKKANKLREEIAKGC